MSVESGILREGARRVWRYQRALWWIFIVNFLLASLSTQPLSARLLHVTGHSLYAQRLVNGFDQGAFSELTGNPDVAFGSAMPESSPAIFVFFIFVLFLTGGILSAYECNYKLRNGEFFQACGVYFWRWVRLCLLMLVVLVPILFAGYHLLSWSGSVIFNKPGPETTGYWIGLGTLLGAMFLMMSVRLWFDMAQVRVIIEDERAIRRAFVRAFKLTFSNFGSLFWLYFRISFLAWLGLAIALWLWTPIPGHRFGISFLVLELALLWWIGTRLWQRAAEVVWYERRVAASATVPVLETATLPQPATMESLPTN